MMYEKLVSKKVKDVRLMRFEFYHVNSDDNGYFDIKYRIETYDGVYILAIPKAEFRLCTDEMPVITNTQTDISRLPLGQLVIPESIVEMTGPIPVRNEQTFILHEKDVSFIDLSGLHEIKNAKYVIYQIRKFENPTKEMTMDELEKILGYKVKIVNDPKKGEKNEKDI